MELAIYQGSGTLGDVAKNLELLAQTAATAKQQGADFLILPELFLTGYNLGNDMKQLAQSQDSAALQQAAAIAHTHQLALLFGYPEQDGDIFYNSAILIDQAGQVVANYRKTHLFGGEQQLFSPGSECVIHSIAGIRVGVLICFDAEFPEAVRNLALQGAELIAIPTANMFPYTLIPEMVIPTRALENQIYVAYVNRIGTEKDLTYCGLSSVVGPDGKNLVKAGLKETLLVTEIDQAAIASERIVYCYLKERRPELY
jgi:5-aminopentanamidase